MIHVADVVKVELLGLSALAVGYNRVRPRSWTVTGTRYHAVRAYMCVRCCVHAYGIVALWCFFADGFGDCFEGLRSIQLGDCLGVV